MKLKNILLGLAALAALSSCSKDFLEQENPNQPTVEQFWRNEVDALAAINATYAPLTFQYRYGFFEYGWGPENWRSDECIYASSYPAFGQIATFINDAQVAEIAELYANCYQMVNRANQCVEGLPKCNMAAEKVTSMVAEARFLRAYAYIKLLNNFRYIPFYPASPKDKDGIYVAQADRATVFALVESDLQEAMNTLPATRVGNELGRATSGSAAGFLAYALVRQQKYADADLLLKKIIKGDYGNYDLLPIAQYSQTYNGANENNIESLFEIQMANVAPKGKTANILQAELLAWQEANASAWIYSQFMVEKDKDKNVDPRYYASMISPALDFETPLGKYEFLSDQNTGRNLILKHTTGSWEPWEKWENNYVLLRFSDILLLEAEAQNELGHTDDALTYINRVRGRANKADLSTGLTKEQFRLRLMDERALELCFEGKRWYDLVRWHEAGWFNIKDVLTAHGKLGVSNFSDKYLYYPIPESEYETNPKLDRNKQW